jgi:hypothetical protein
VGWQRTCKHNGDTQKKNAKRLDVFKSNVPHQHQCQRQNHHQQQQQPYNYLPCS